MGVVDDRWAIYRSQADKHLYIVETNGSGRVVLTAQAAAGFSSADFIGAMQTKTTPPAAVPQPFPVFGVDRGPCGRIGVVAQAPGPGPALVPAPGPDIWQLATAATDAGNGIAIDSAGNVLVIGTTSGDIDGNGGGRYQGGIGDVFFAQYRPDGQVVWINHIGTSGNEAGMAIARDGSDNVYITGETRGPLAGPNSLVGSGDILLGKYNRNGVREWIQQFGTTTEDRGNAVAVDGQGNVYVAGYTLGEVDGANHPPFGDQDAFLAKYDSNGNRLWIRQLSTGSHDYATGVTVDVTGNVYIAGLTDGDMDGTGAQTYHGASDIFVAKYDSSGTQQWAKQFGTSGADEARSMTSDGGNVFVTGITNGDLDGAGSQTYRGESDLFILKLDSSGNVQWLRQHGTFVGDEANGITLDGLGNVYLTGITTGDHDGAGAGVNAGGGDIFVLKYDSNGNLRWIRQRGSNQYDAGHVTAADASGSVFLAGTSFRDITTDSAGPSQGLNDVVIMRYGVEQP